MPRFILTFFLMVSPLFAFAQSFNNEIEMEFGESVLTLVLRDEGGHASFNSLEKVLRSKRVIAMSVKAPEGTYFDDEEKAQLILTLRHKCDLLGETHLVNEQVQMAKTSPDLNLTDFSSEVVDSTISLADDQIFGRCHLDLEAQ